MKTKSVIIKLIAAVILITAFLIQGCGGGGGPQPNVGTVFGKVTNVWGGAASGVTVSIGEIRALTGDDGKYKLNDIPAGTQPITGVKAGYRDYSSSIYVSAGMELEKNFEISPSGSGIITGIVTDALGGNLQGVTVACGESQFITGADGQFELKGVPAGIQTITGNKTGYREYSGSVRVEEGQTVTKNFEMSTLTN